MRVPAPHLRIVSDAMWRAAHARREARTPRQGSGRDFSSCGCHGLDAYQRTGGNSPTMADGTADSPCGSTGPVV